MINNFFGIQPLTFIFAWNEKQELCRQTEVFVE